MIKVCNTCRYNKPTGSCKYNREIGNFCLKRNPTGEIEYNLWEPKNKSQKYNNYKQNEFKILNYKIKNYILDLIYHGYYSSDDCKELCKKLSCILKEAPTDILLEYINIKCSEDIYANHR